jgi:hypothetical protein
VGGGARRGATGGRGLARRRAGTRTCTSWSRLRWRRRRCRSTSRSSRRTSSSWRRPPTRRCPTRTTTCWTAERARAPGGRRPGAAAWGGGAGRGRRGPPRPRPPDAPGRRTAARSAIGRAWLWGPPRPRMRGDTHLGGRGAAGCGSAGHARQDTAGARASRSRLAHARARARWLTAVPGERADGRLHGVRGSAASRRS